MKMFKFLVAIILLALCAPFTSCEYDDSEIWSQVEDLLARVQKLETSCEQQNSNIAALQSLLNGIKDNVYVTSVSEMDDKKGYFLEFSNGEKVAIYHGENGLNGETTSLTIVKEGDNYYWSVNGEILKDEDGNQISANGSGDLSPVLKTGSQLEIEGVVGTWEKDAVYVSVDRTSWIKVVTSDTTQIFTSVEVSEDNLSVIITLADGSVISMAKTEKMLELLYGKWESTVNIGTWTFSRDMTFTFSNKYQNDEGTFEFIPERYIHIHSDYSSILNGELNKVLTIASISDSTLYIASNFGSGSDGKFKRVSQNNSNAGGGIVWAE